MFKGLIRGGLLLTLLLLVGTSELRAQSSVSFLPNGSLTGVTSSGSSTTFSTPILLPDGTAAAPSLGFASNPEKGLYFASDLVFNNNTARFAIGQGQTRVSSNMAFGWASGAATSSLDVSLYRDAANTLALRNSTNAQTFNIYNTYTDGSNFERTSILCSGSYCGIGTQKAGTGASRAMHVYSNWAGGFMGLGGTVVGSPQYQLSDTYLTSVNNDGQTLGNSGTQWQHVYLSRSIQGSKSKSLTDAGAAVSIWRIAVPTNGYAGGKLIFTANSTDGTDRLTTTGEVTFAGADTAGTVTCGIGTPYGLVTAYRRANTLLCTFTAVTSTTNCDIQVTCTDNLAGAQTMAIESRLDMPTPNTVTPQ